MDKRPVMTFYPSLGKWVARSFKDPENTELFISENPFIAFGAWLGFQLANQARGPKA